MDQDLDMEQSFESLFESSMQELNVGDVVVGTVVFPGADVKFFLLASAEVRGRRRFLELQAKGVDVDLARTIAEVEARDAADSSRASSPLRKAEDAVVIDTTELDIPQVLERMFTVVKARQQGEDA